MQRAHFIEYKRKGALSGIGIKLCCLNFIALAGILDRVQLYLQLYTLKTTE